MGITERLANLPMHVVVVAVVVLLVARFVLLRQPSKLAKSLGEAAESLAVALGLVFLIIRPFVVQAFFIPSPSMHPTLIENDHIMVSKFIYRFREPARGDVVVFQSPPEAGKDEAEFIKRVVAVPGDVVRITKGYLIVGSQHVDHASLRQLSRDPFHSTVKLTRGGKVYVDGKSMPLREVAKRLQQPGEPVKVIAGRVYVNGEPIDEPYIAEDPQDIYPGGHDTMVKSRWIIIDKTGEKAVKIPPGKLLVMGDNRNASHDSRFWGLLDRSRVLGKAMFVFWPPSRMRWIR